MDIVSNLDEANQILASDKSLMISMDNNFECWIQAGIRDENGNLVANGRRVARLSNDVFDALIPSMAQVFCSEFFQPEVGSSEKNSRSDY